MPSPPYDPELEPALEPLVKSSLSVIGLEKARQRKSPFTVEALLQQHPDLEHEEHVASGTDGNEIPLSVFKPKGRSSGGNSKPLPVFYFVHAGGQIVGSRLDFLSTVLTHSQGIERIAVSVGYRLAPEHKAPAALHDVYSGLLWLEQNAAEHGIDLSNVVICGSSGGGPMATGATMLSIRDRKPFPSGLMLLAPMLDDRGDTVSSKQFAEESAWSGSMNKKAWEYVLGGTTGGGGDGSEREEVSELLAPARATDLTGFPPTFVDVGSSEVFRDECVAFASQLWKSGVLAELHVWPGGYHGFDSFVPTAAVSKAALAAKTSWVHRIMGGRT